MTARGNLAHLAVNATKAMSGSVIYAIAQTVALAIVSRKGGTTDAAHWFLAQALATPLAFFCSLRLKEQLAVDTEKGSFIHRISRSLLLASVLGTLATILWVVFSSGQLRTVGIAFLWANFAQQLGGAYQGQRARSSSFLLPSQLDSLFGLSSLLAVFLGYQMSGLGTAAILTAILWWAVALPPVIREVVRELPTRTRSTIPLSHEAAVGTSALSQNSQISVARIGAQIFAGDAAIAAIGAASFFVRLGVLATVGVRSAMGPRLASAKERGTIDTLIGRIQGVTRLGTIVGGAAGFVVGFLFGRAGIELLFGSAVLPTRLTAGLILMSAVLLYGSMILGQALITLDRRWALAQATTGALLATALVIAPLALAFGEEGAAGALGAGYAARYLLVERAIRRGGRAVLTRKTITGGLLLSAVIIAPLAWIAHGVSSPPDDVPSSGVDAIVVLNGGRGERLDLALEIRTEHPDAALVLTIPPHAATADSDMEVREYCSANSVDSSITCVEIVDDSTAGEAAAASTLINEQAWKSVVVVTSDFHASRAKLLFKRCGVDPFMAPAKTTFARDRIPREVAATIDALVLSRTCLNVREQ